MSARRLASSNNPVTPFPESTSIADERCSVCQGATDARSRRAKTHDGEVMVHAACLIYIDPGSLEETLDQELDEFDDLDEEFGRESDMF